MIYKKGNLLDAEELVIAHGCNCQGVMGSGVAKAIREKWPVAYEVYRKHYDVNGLELGDYVAAKVDHNKYVVNLLTQANFGVGQRHVNYSALAKSVIHMVENFVEISKFALPKIGAGLGGGDWALIETLLKDIEKMYEIHNIEFVVYEL